MITYQIQKKLQFIPIANFITFPVAIFVNRHYFIDMWQFKLFPYMLATLICCLPLTIFTKYTHTFFESYNLSFIWAFVMAYWMGTFSSIWFLMAQKRLIREPHQKQFNTRGRFSCVDETDPPSDQNSTD